MKFKILIALVIIESFLSINICYAKYVYKFEEEIIELTRDDLAPICSVNYSEENPTNENVIVTINCNKEVQPANGFVLSEDKKTLSKELSQNENSKIEVRDFSGNSTEIEYNVDNIDKEFPEIVGISDGGFYEKPVKLDFTDNQEIKEISVDKFEDNLLATVNENYLDSYLYKGIDRTSSTITIHITGHPRNTKKYKLYINNRLYTTTNDTDYTFTDLQSGTDYTIKIEAIDESSNVLDNIILKERTSYFQNIESIKTENEFIAKMKKLDNSVKKVRYAVWNSYDENNKQWYESKVLNSLAEIKCKKVDSVYYPLYIIHAYLYDADENILDVIEFAIDFGTNYEKFEDGKNINEITESGNYQVKVKDSANNEIIYYIKVE